MVNRLQTGEKVPISFRLEVTNPGGHSSRPRKDNAIYQLAEGLVRLSAFEFPASLNETTRDVLRAHRDASTAASSPTTCAVRRRRRPIRPRWPGCRLIRSTTARCGRPAWPRGSRAATPPTRLPQTARATVNCRVLPGEKPEDVQATLVRVLASDKITVTATGEFIASPPSPLNPDLMSRVERITTEMWPGALVIPSMSTGATDSRWLRNAGIQSYGVSGLFYAQDSRAHGMDEHVSVSAFYEGQTFLYRLVKDLGSAQ